MLIVFVLEMWNTKLAITDVQLEGCIGQAIEEGALPFENLENPLAL